MFTRSLRLHAGPRTLEYALSQQAGPIRAFASRLPRPDDDHARHDTAEASTDVDGSSNISKKTTLPGKLRVKAYYKPYQTSEHLRTFLDSPKRALLGKRGARNPENTQSMKPGFELDVAEEIVKKAPRQSANVAVWNQLLTACRDAGAHNRAWDLYNDVSKSDGVQQFAMH